MVYRPDPAGVFLSDVHRRVLAALPSQEDFAIALEYAVAPVLADENLPFVVADQPTLTAIKAVVEELAGQGLVLYDDETRLVQRTTAGQTRLEAEVAFAVADLTDEEIAKREADNAAKAVADAARAAEQRIEVYERAQAEIAEAIERDKALVAEASA